MNSTEVREKSRTRLDTAMRAGLGLNAGVAGVVGVCAGVATAILPLSWGELSNTMPFEVTTDSRAAMVRVGNSGNVEDDLSGVCCGSTACDCSSSTAIGYGRSLLFLWLLLLLSIPVNDTRAFSVAHETLAWLNRARMVT